MMLLGYSQCVCIYIYIYEWHSNQNIGQSRSLNKSTQLTVQSIAHIFSRNLKAHSSYYFLFAMMLHLLSHWVFCSTEENKLEVVIHSYCTRIHLVPRQPECQLSYETITPCLRWVVSHHACTVLFKAAKHLAFCIENPTFIMLIENLPPSAHLYIFANLFN